MNLSKQEIADIIAEVQNNPNTKLRRAISLVYAGKGTTDDLHMVLGAAESLEAFFDLRKLAEDQLGAVFMNAVQGYLRRSRSGGMDSEESDMVEATMEDFVRIGCLAEVVIPFIDKTKK